MMMKIIISSKCNKNHRKFELFSAFVKSENDSKFNNTKFTTNSKEVKKVLVVEWYFCAYLTIYAMRFTVYIDSK